MPKKVNMRLKKFISKSFCQTAERYKLVHRETCLSSDWRKVPVPRRPLSQWVTHCGSVSEALKH